MTTMPLLRGQATLFHSGIKDNTLWRKAHTAPPPPPVQLPVKSHFDGNIMCWVRYGTFRYELYTSDSDCGVSCSPRSPSTHSDWHGIPSTRACAALPFEFVFIIVYIFNVCWLWRSLNSHYLRRFFQTVWLKLELNQPILKPWSHANFQQHRLKTPEIMTVSLDGQYSLFFIRTFQNIQPRCS